MKKNKRTGTIIRYWRVFDIEILIAMICRERREHTPTCRLGRVNHMSAAIDQRLPTIQGYPCCWLENVLFRTRECDTLKMVLLKE